MSEGPLHRAIIDNDVAEVVKIKEHLGDIDFEDEQGYTPLELALLLGRGQCVQILNPAFNPLIKIVLKNDHIVSHLDVDNILIKMGLSYCPTLRFENAAFLHKIMKKPPRVVDESVEDLGIEKREEIYLDKTANVTVVWVKDALGYGVVTNRNLKAGDLIGEYAGLVRPVSRMMPLVNGYCLEYPACWGSGKYVIDAKVYGNVMRYINHSDVPNLEGKWALDRGLMHLLLFAGEDIPRGAELTLNYGRDYWQARQKV